MQEKAPHKSMPEGTQTNPNPSSIKQCWQSPQQATESNQATILFDEGSQRSFITDNLAMQLQLVPERVETVSLSDFGGTSSSVKQVAVATIYLQTDSGDPIPIEVIIVPAIAAPLQNHIPVDFQELPYLQGLKLAHPISNESVFEIDLLIGVDLKSKIGYLLSRPVANTYPSTMVRTAILHVMTAHKQDGFELERFWNLKLVGIQLTEITDKGTNFLHDYQDFFRENGYNAKLPWKSDHPPLLTNSNKRFCST